MFESNIVDCDLMSSRNPGHPKPSAPPSTQDDGRGDPTQGTYIKTDPATGIVITTDASTGAEMWLDPKTGIVVKLKDRIY